MSINDKINHAEISDSMNKSADNIEALAAAYIKLTKQAFISREQLREMEQIAGKLGITEESHINKRTRIAQNKSERVTNFSRNR